MEEKNADFVRQIQRIGFQILCEIDKYCETNQLTYYLSGGTCLGAVRHQGFIPWDEDVDIMMPRKDYERLIHDFEKSYQGKYKVGALETNSEWTRTYARIWDLNTELCQTKLSEIKMGIFVDIFPIDGLPDNLFRQRLFFANIKILSILKNASIRTDFFENEKNKILKKIMAFFVQPIGGHRFAVKIDKMAKKFLFDSSNYVGASMALHYGMKEKIERKYMEKGILLPFENGEFPVPIGYDKYLTNLYGEYMSIPENAVKQGYSHLDGWTVKINVDAEDVKADS